MFSKDDKSLKFDVDTKKTRIEPSVTSTLTIKKKIPKNDSTREFDRNYALRLIRDHLSLQESLKAESS